MKYINAYNRFVKTEEIIFKLKRKLKLAKISIERLNLADCNKFSEPKQIKLLLYEVSNFIPI